MIDSWTFYAVAIPAVFLTGLAKGGFSGMGSLSLPAMAFVINPVQAAAILLPLLIVQDVVGIWAFRKTVDWGVLGWMLPGAAVGVGLGYIYAATVTPEAVMAAVGVISALFGVYRLWLARHAMPRETARMPEWVGALFGVASGITSQIAHAGQPPFQLWVLPRKLSPQLLVGTTAVFFGVVNWIKVPAYLALGQFTRENLLTAAALLPVAISSTMVGVWLVRRISPERFYTAIYWLMIAVGVALVWEAAV